MRRTLVIAVLALSTARSVRAGDAIKMEVVRKGQTGTAAPMLVLIPAKAVSELEARIECGGAWAEYKGGATTGQRIELKVDVNPGVYTCTGSLSADFDDGTSGEMPLSVQLEMLPPLGITVPKEKVDLAARRMVVVLDRPASRVDVACYGAGGTLLGQGTAPAQGQPANSPIDVGWTQSPGEVLKIEVRGTDQDEFFARLDLFPWRYEIPHEDVVFDTNMADIKPMEVGKLNKALGEVQAVVQKYGKDVPVNLYVGGYTDTVGDQTQNRYLSEKRAAAIANWFKSQGFAGHISCQGFGEKGLAVPTPDEVDEVRNRRAVYILAADAPPVSSSLPGSAWVKLQ